MRRILVAAALCATLLPIAACSDGPESESTAQPGATTSTGAGASPGASGAPGATGAPGDAPAATTDKAACEALSAKLGTWGGEFATAASGITDAGNDVGKVQAVIDKVRAANSKFAEGLRAEGTKAKDAAVTKVAGDLAAALEKISSSLNAQQVAANPDALLAIFDSPEYMNAAETFEKLCGRA